MRDSSAEEQRRGVVLVLDTIEDCKVIYDALSDPLITLGNPNLSFDYQDKTTLAYRFRDQARIDRSIMAQTGRSIGVPIYEGWKQSPRFEVLEDDLGLVLVAAKRLLTQRKVADQLFNRLTGRTGAAKKIASEISHLLIKPAYKTEKSDH